MKFDSKLLKITVNSYSIDNFEDGTAYHAQHDANARAAASAK